MSIAAPARRKSDAIEPPVYQDLPRPLGPDSCTWHDFGSYLFHLMLPQAFVLQSAHPVVDAAITREKKYKHDPWGRAKASVTLLWPVVYARPEKAIAKGVELRELHRHIKGVDASGRKYHALDPEAYCWVHLTGFDATLRMYELFGHPVSRQQRARLFEEWKQMGALLGIADRYLPQTEAEYWDDFHYIIRERLEYGEALRDLLAPDFYAHYPRPPQLSWLPQSLWKGLAKAMSGFVHRLTLATLPQTFRTRFGLHLTPGDERLFRAFAWLVRTLYPLLPERMRYIPLAQRAIADARRHPDAYQFNYQ